MTAFSRMLAAAGAALVFGFAAAPGQAQSGPEYFNGKTVNYIVATDPGGGYDTNGRLVAQFMQKHLPGSTFVVRNMPGAGHMIGANHVYASPADGLTMGTFNTGLIYAQLTGAGGVKFDLGKMSWIGKLAADPRVLVVSEQSGIKTFEDLMAQKETIKFAAAGVGSASTVEATMLVNSIKMPVQIITGYNGNDDQLALRRGEVQGILASRSSFEQFVQQGYGHFIAQIGGSQTDVPQLSTLVGDNADAQRVIALVGSQADIARLTAAPPGVPDDVLKTLRDAYEAAITDPEFLQKAKELGLPIDPLVGEPVHEAVMGALDQTPEMVEFLKTTLAAK